MRVFFDFIFTAPAKGDQLFTPFADICAKKLNTDDKGNRTIITPTMTESEVDQTIDSLIRELESIRRKIKSKFISHRK
jgi:hypothetical protein